MKRRVEMILRETGFLDSDEVLIEEEVRKIEDRSSGEQKESESAGELMMEDLVDDVDNVYGSGCSLKEIRESVENRSDVLEDLESQIDSHQSYHDEFMEEAENAESRTEAFQFARQATRQQWKLRMKEKLRNKIFSEMEEMEKKAMSAEMGAINEQNVFGVSPDDFEEERAANEIRQTKDNLKDDIESRSKSDIELDRMMERTGVTSVQEKMNQVDKLRSGELTEEEVSVEVNPVPGAVDKSAEEEEEAEGSDRGEAGSVYDT